MDLRIIKTRYQIKDAFLKLRNKLMPEKIKVKDICEAAMINKTTFYKHYTDAVELSNEIDDSAIGKITSNLPDRAKLYSDTRAFVSELFSALEREAEEIKIVFRGKQEIFLAKLEDKLRDYYCNVSEYLNEIRTSFAIAGVVRVAGDYLFTDEKHNIQEIVSETTKMIEALLNADD